MKQLLTNTNEWIEDDWINVDFGDKRLNKRAKNIAFDLLRSPFDSPPKMLKESKKIKAFYRALDSEKVTHDKIISDHIQNTKNKMSNHKVILSIQDSITISLSRNYAIEGLYSVGSVQGLVVQNTISVVPEENHGVIGGLLNQIILKRKPKKRRNEKNNEIKLWLESIKAVKKPENTTVIDVCDRGADSLRVMNCSEQNGHEFVIRAQHNRVIKEGHLFDFARNLQTIGYIDLEIQGTSFRKKRTAKLRIAFSKVTIEPSKEKLEPMQVTIIHVLETNPPKKQEPLQ